MSDEATGTIEVTAPDNTGSQTTETATDETAEATQAPVNWLESVPEDIRTLPEFEAALKDAEAYKGIERPPEKADGYKIEGLEGEALKSFGEFAHKVGLTQKQAEGLVAEIKEQNTKAEATRAENRKKAIDGIKADTKAKISETHGKDAAQYERGALEGRSKWASPELVAMLQKTGLEFELPVMDLFYKLNALRLPDILVPSTGKQPAPQERNKSGTIDIQYDKNKEK